MNTDNARKFLKEFLVQKSIQAGEPCTPEDADIAIDENQEIDLFLEAMEEYKKAPPSK